MWDMGYTMIYCRSVVSSLVLLVIVEVGTEARVIVERDHFSGCTVNDLLQVLVASALLGAVVSRLEKVRPAVGSTKKQLSERPGRSPPLGLPLVLNPADLDPALAIVSPQGQDLVSLLQGYDSATLGLLLDHGDARALPTQPKPPIYHAGQASLAATQPKPPIYHASQASLAATQPKPPMYHAGQASLAATQPKPPIYHASHAPLEVARPKSLIHSEPLVQLGVASTPPKPAYYSRESDTQEQHNQYAARYEFGYRVHDTHTGTNFGQTEHRNGDITLGHYHVMLPDGRLQNVQYWSDHSGFHAKVSYDRQAHHPQHYASQRTAVISD